MYEPFSQKKPKHIVSYGIVFYFISRFDYSTDYTEFKSDNVLFATMRIIQA